MSAVQIVTDKDTGQRTYNVGLGPKYSNTTLLKAYPKNLAYAAGLTSAEAVAAVAHDTAKMLAQTNWSDEDYATGGIAATFEDFEFQVLTNVRALYGQTKAGRIVPPHDTIWGWKRETGTAIHIGVERHNKALLMRTDLPPVMEESDVYLTLPAEWQAKAVKALDAFYNWRNRTKYDPFAAEDVVWLEAGESGVDTPVATRIDVGAYIEGAFVIADVKSGSLEKGKPYREQMIQTEIQRRAWNARRRPDQPVATQAGILHVPADGGPVRLFLSPVEEQDRLARSFDIWAKGYIDMHGEAK